MVIPLATLQDAFYIIGIIFMGIILILVTAIVVAVFVIRAKVVSLQRQVQDAIDETMGAAAKGGELVVKAARATVGRAKQVARRGDNRIRGRSR